MALSGPADPARALTDPASSPPRAVLPVLDERQIEEEKQITAQFKAFHDTLTTLICLLDIVDRDRLVPEVCEVVGKRDRERERERERGREGGRERERKWGREERIIKDKVLYGKHLRNVI